MPEPDKNLTGDQERVEAMWSPLRGVIIVRNTASGDKIEFGEEAWQAFLDGHRGISGESGRRLAALRELHAPHRIYDECGHDHAEDDPAAVRCSDFITCEEAFEYEICRHCCTEGEDFSETEECASQHDHGPGKPLCLTAVILEGGEVSE
ncbi:MAG TPA: hypothetical protein VIZ43_08400 [Trebonia sp.]